MRRRISRGGGRSPHARRRRDRRARARARLLIAEWLRATSRDIGRSRSSRVRPGSERRHSSKVLPSWRALGDEARLARGQCRAVWRWRALPARARRLLRSRVVVRTDHRSPARSHTSRRTGFCAAWPAHGRATKARRRRRTSSTRCTSSLRASTRSPPKPRSSSFSRMFTEAITRRSISSPLSRGVVSRPGCWCCARFARRMRSCAGTPSPSSGGLVRKGLCHEILLDDSRPRRIESLSVGALLGCGAPRMACWIFSSIGPKAIRSFSSRSSIICSSKVSSCSGDGRWNLLGSVNDPFFAPRFPRGCAPWIEPRLERLPEGISAPGARDGERHRTGLPALTPFPGSRRRRASWPTSSTSSRSATRWCGARRSSVLRARAPGPRARRARVTPSGTRSIDRSSISDSFVATPRRRLHQSVGEGLVEQAYGGRTAEVASELASHFERSRDVDRAVRYRAEAAAQARSRSAYRESRLPSRDLLSRSSGLNPKLRNASRQEIALLQDFGVLRCSPSTATATRMARAPSHGCVSWPASSTVD